MSVDVEIAKKLINIFKGFGYYFLPLLISMGIFLSVYFTVVISYMISHGYNLEYVIFNEKIFQEMKKY